MIVRDTNVISELFRPLPEPAVIDWMARQPATALFTTAITRSEPLYGVKRLPAGRWQDALLEGLTRWFDRADAGTGLRPRDAAARPARPRDRIPDVCDDDPAPARRGSGAGGRR